ncbi:NnrS family protein [Aliidiomarina halalkaliphila]|uniref:NnrS family protein n=1 Tax=Aliidiomarina halalkaliphila TaxID=2593535 RepID=A0A552X421_9GAMM|nr:NnrS family protein [Aliidiomarina halalkaliphila]TRW49649.1 NnrS family protein [Aliidiomarina halalkaliphila]
MQITHEQKEQGLFPLWRQAFRPFFLLGAVFSLVAMVLWGAVLTGHITLNPYHNVMFWHQHEMLFGFVVAIILGFLLTAVQNWTGLRATHGGSLIILIALWLSARMLMLFGAGLPAWLVVTVDLALLPTAAFLFGRLLVRAGQSRNLFFVPILLALALMNGATHAGVLYGRFDWIQYGTNSAVWLITLIMVIISGRVLPMFTANGTQTERVQPKAWIELGALCSVWLIVVLHVFALTGYIPDRAFAVLFAFAGLMTTIRLLRLRFWITLRTPLLWSLHLSVAFIPLALFLFAMRYAGIEMIGSVSHSTAVHTLTVGAMGVMIMAMMARVSLGHSGRPLRASPWMSVAFLLIIAAALVRIGANWGPIADMMTWYQWSATFWAVAFLIFILVYLPVFLSPRADGRPG